MTAIDPSPLDHYPEVFDDAELEAWAERAEFDANTPAEIAAHTEPQAASHPLHGWMPDDDDAAEWAMHKLAELLRERARLDAEHDAWIERVEASRRAATRGLVHRIAFFQEALTGYAIAWHAEMPNVRKTLRLPSGDVSTTTPTKPNVRLVASYTAKVVEWLQGLPAAKVAEAKALKVPEPEPLISGVRKLVRVERLDSGQLVAVDLESGEILTFLAVEGPGPTTATPKPDLTER